MAGAQCATYFELHEQVDIVLYSIGAFEGESISGLYLGDYLVPADYQSMRENGVVGDIANIMIRADGTFADVPLNMRAGGPDLQLLSQASRAIAQSLDLINWMD